MKHKLKEMKGGSARQVRIELQRNVGGVSEQLVQNIINKERKMQLLNVRFTNKPIHRPVTARFVHQRHQIDIVSMSRVKYKGIQQRYVLDVFSRYVWLRALPRKSSKAVTKAVETIYEEHGPPKTVQSDNGGEFKGEFDRYLDHHGIDHARSRAYNPQAQGKVERSHRSLKKLIHYDMIGSSKGVNWAKRLPTYARLMNTRPRKCLG